MHIAGGLTESSTKTFPFFFPFGKSTPTGVIILSFGIPNSSSVYIRFFFFAGRAAGLVFCCLGGGAFSFLEIRVFDVPPDDSGFLEPLVPLMFFEDDLTVRVGPIFYVELCELRGSVVDVRRGKF